MYVFTLMEDELSNKRVLVFNDDQDMLSYYEKVEDAPTRPDGTVIDTNLGAVYKALSEPYQRGGKHRAVVRSGQTGSIIWEDTIPYTNYINAMAAAVGRCAGDHAKPSEMLIPMMVEDAHQGPDSQGDAEDIPCFILVNTAKQLKIYDDAMKMLGSQTDVQSISMCLNNNRPDGINILNYRMEKLDDDIEIAPDGIDMVFHRNGFMQLKFRILHYADTAVFLDAETVAYKTNCFNPITDTVIKVNKTEKMYRGS